MAKHVDKLIVTNRTALKAKYGAAGEKRIRAALSALVEADRRRGLSAKVLLFDNVASMRTLGAKRALPTDWEGAVRAVDLAWQVYTPSYVLLVGAEDVVPQARVSNPFGAFGDDPDPYVPSDLPYACDLPDGWTLPASRMLNPGDLVGVTRVVGRIPDLVGASEPSFLLERLAALTTWSSRAPGAYRDLFALSAAAWQGSSRHTVDLLTDPATVLNLSPPSKSPWTTDKVAPRVHFVNCHGGDTTPDWFGQAPPVHGRPSPVDVVALRPEDIAGHIAEGTVVAAECCYGALHAAPSDLGGRLPMMWTYLQAGAYACVGSSTTAYGPSDGNGQADLLTRFVLEAIRGGSSAGRALLEARQRFVREAGSLDPSDLKTLVQFDLLGDPSVHPVQLDAAPPAKGVTPTPKALPASASRDRRVVLRAMGRALFDSVTRAAIKPEKRARVAPRALATAAGIAVEHVVGPVQSFAERSSKRRSGRLFHAAPIRIAERRGFVVAKDRDGVLTATAVWAKSALGSRAGGRYPRSA
jgi:hypothetical protein